VIRTHCTYKKYDVVIVRNILPGNNENNDRCEKQFARVIMFSKEITALNQTYCLESRIMCRGGD